MSGGMQTDLLRRLQMTMVSTDGGSSWNPFDEQKHYALALKDSQMLFRAVVLQRRDKQTGLWVDDDGREADVFRFHATGPIFKLDRRTASSHLATLVRFEFVEVES